VTLLVEIIAKDYKISTSMVISSLIMSLNIQEHILHNRYRQ